MLHARKATPDLIRQKLDFIDAEAGDRRFFWGRFARKWDYYWLAAGAGQIVVVAKDAKLEDWHRYNLLVEFGRRVYQVAADR